MPKFEIHSKLGGRFYFEFKAADGEVIISSRDFDSKQKCEDAIVWIKNTPFDKMYDIHVSSEDDYLLCLKDQHDKVIGCSKQPESFPDVTRKKNVIKGNMKTAEVVDLSLAIRSDFFVPQH